MHFRCRSIELKRRWSTFWYGTTNLISLAMRGLHPKDDVTAWFDCRLILLIIFGCVDEPADAPILQGEWTSCVLMALFSYRRGSGFYQGSKRHIILKILLCSIPPTRMFHTMFHAYFTSPTIYLLSHHRLLHWYDNNIMSPIIWLSLAIARRVKTVYLLVTSLVTSSVWQIFIILPKTWLTIILAFSNQFIHSTWDVSIFVMFWTFYLPVFVRTMVLPGTLPKSIRGSYTR